MSLDTVEIFAHRINSYSTREGISVVQIVFHGGEPMLVGKKYLKECIRIFTEAAPGIKFSYTIQTNGVLLDAEWYKFFNENNIILGISIDGPKEFHDAYRVYNNGKGSYDKVAEAVRIGNQNQDLRGILNVINTKIPPAIFYAEMKDLGVQSINLLLPDGHHDNLPDGFEKARVSERQYTPYADWLIELFCAWKQDKMRPAIKFFEHLIFMVMGDDHIGNQNFGRRPNGVLIIETNGGIETADSLRACYEGFTKNDLNVHKDEISDIFPDRVFQLYYNAHEMVSETCLNCALYDVCGGGFLGHRYSYENGFFNRMIYCKDIVKLLCFIQNDIIDGLSDDVQGLINSKRLTYNEIMGDIESQKHSIIIDEDIREFLLSFRKDISYESEKRCTTV